LLEIGSMTDAEALSCPARVQSFATAENRVRSAIARRRVGYPYLPRVNVLCRAAHDQTRGGETS